MNKSDIRAYTEGKLIAQDITKIISDNSKKELTNYPAFQKWVTTNSQSYQTIEMLSDIELLDENLRNFSNCSNMENDIKRLSTAINKKHGRRLIITISAVAAVIVASFGVWYSINNHEIEDVNVNIKVERPNYLSQKEDILQPTLLVGGQKINLSKEMKEVKMDNQTIASNDGDRLSYLNSVSDIHENSIIVPKMKTFSVELEDGTMVVLNANSQLTYQSKFVGKNREVYLKGEAFFDVAKNDKPFIVKTDNATIKVYGTKFNVNTHMKDVFKTTLISGSLGVTKHNNQGIEIMISPNEMLTYDIKNNTETIKKVHCEKYTAWLDGYFRSDAESIVALLEEISAWYGVDFTYNKATFNNVNINTWYNRELSLENILKSLEIIVNVEFIKTAEDKYELS